MASARWSLRPRGLKEQPFFSSIFISFISLKIFIFLPLVSFPWDHLPISASLWVYVPFLHLPSYSKLISLLYLSPSDFLPQLWGHRFLSAMIKICPVCSKIICQSWIAWTIFLLLYFTSSPQAHIYLIPHICNLQTYLSMRSTRWHLMLDVTQG